MFVAEEELAVMYRDIEKVAMVPKVRGDFPVVSRAAVKLDVVFVASVAMMLKD